MVRASRVLPEPGGPRSRRPCRPASAISSARRASGWPRTSARSGTRRPAGIAHRRLVDAAPGPHRLQRARPAPGTWSLGGVDASRISSTASDEAFDAEDLDPVDQSGLSHRGARPRPPAGSPALASAATIGSTPGTGRTSPPSDSSPISAIRPGAGSDLLRTEEDPDGDREIERRAGLAQIRRREVDRDPSRRIDEAGVPERAADAFPRLLEGGIGEPDDGEPGQPRRDVHLDPDQPPVEAMERRGWDDGQHAMAG